MPVINGYNIPNRGSQWDLPQYESLYNAMLTEENMTNPWGTLFTDEFQVAPMQNYRTDLQRELVSSEYGINPNDVGLSQPSSERSYANPLGLLSSVVSDPRLGVQEDFGSNLFNLGRTLAYKPNNDANRQFDKKSQQTGKTLSLIGRTGTAILQGTRSIMQGFATQKRDQEAMDAYYRNMRDAIEGAYEYAADGGTFGGKTVEVERGEFLRTPEGTLEEVSGRTHEQGGEELFLQFGTEVTSDNRKIGNKGVTKIQEMFPKLKLHVTPTDTYADVIRKTESKIGLKKKEDEINSTSDQLKKLTENYNGVDKTTYMWNSQFLQNKLNQLNSERDILQQSQLLVADAVFNLQEESKGRVTSKLNNYFKKGGKVTEDSIKIISKKTGYPLNYLRGYFGRKMSSLQKLAEGDTITFSQERNSFAQPEYGYQPFTNLSVGASTAGNVLEDTFQRRIAETFRIFPQATRFFDAERDENGNITGIQFKDKNSVKDYQEYVNKVYNNIEKYADDNIKDEVSREKLKSYVSGLRFDTSDPNSVKFTDNVFGDFTSSRSGVGLPLVTESELKNLSSKNINNFSKLFGEDGLIRTDIELSDDTINRLTSIRDTYGKDFEANLLSIKQQQQIADTTVPTNTVQDTTNQVGNTLQQLNIEDQSDNLNFTNKEKAPFTIPFIPDQYRTDYDTLTGHMLITPRYGRLSPTQRSAEGAITEVYSAFDTGRSTVDRFSDPQRLAVLSNMVAGTQTAINQVMSEVDAWNALNEQQVNSFNLSQQNREEDSRVRELRTFEQLQLSAMTKTDKNNEIINEHNKKVRLGNFEYINRLKSIHDMFPNYGVSSTGSIYRDPNMDATFDVPTNMGQYMTSEQLLQMSMAERQKLLASQAKRNTKN